MNIMDIPDGRSGDWEIDTFTITEEQAELANLRMAWNGAAARYVLPGTYKRLLHFNQTVMSNTRAELRDHAHFISRAKGNVLVNGLGLGCILVELLNKDEVEHITVIEKSEDVIKLVATFFNGKVDIINDDAFKWKPPKGIRYGAVWHDIWNFISGDNVDEMISLHRKYGKRCDYQESWCRHLCELNR